MPLTGAAAARLYDDHVDAVHALIARRVGAAAAPEITADAFELALRTWDQFDAERGTERLFVFGAATTAIRRHPEIEREHLRALRIPRGGSVREIYDPLVTTPDDRSTRPATADPAIDDDDGDPTPVIDSASDSLDGRAMRAVADLDPDDRDIVLLSLWESCSQTAIAEVLDMNVGTVRSSLGRIRRELKVAVTEDAS